MTKKRNTLLDPVLPVNWVAEECKRRNRGLQNMNTFGPELTQPEPTGPALGNYPVPDRRRTMGEKIARFLRDLADRAQSWT